MSAALLDLADCNLQLWHRDRLVQSPGYALFDKHQFIFGQAARQAARLRPRDINTRFWWHLGTEPLQPPLGKARHTGDLAHAHLNALHEEAGQPDEIVFAVPSTMGREQLALLLGIAQQCAFNAVGLVNRSVAIGSLHSSNDKVLHLELQLHQASLTELHRDGDLLSLGGHQALPGCGLLQLQERLVEAIATSFVQQSRFDPRRRAQTEQQLYDALPGLLRTLQHQDEANMDIAGYQARVGRADLARCGDKLLHETRQARDGQHGADTPLLLDPLAALLPGLEEELRASVIGTDSVRRALLEQQDNVVQREEELHFVTALPCSTTQPAPGLTPAPEASSDEQTQPTHLLSGFRARALQAAGTPLQEGWLLRRDTGNWHLEGNGPPLFVNDEPHIAGQALVAGDIIRIGDTFTASLITVEAGDTPG